MYGEIKSASVHYRPPTYNKPTMNEHVKIEIALSDCVDSLFSTFIY